MPLQRRPALPLRDDLGAPRPELALSDTTLGARHDASGPGDPVRRALVVVWCREEPHRAGQRVEVDRPVVLGRGEPSFGPAGALRTPLASRHLSRQQLRVAADRGGVLVENLGRCALLHRGVEAAQALLRPGDLVELDEAQDELPDGAPEPERWGLVGEGPAIERLRRDVRAAAASDRHVLVLGPSGAGKELVARALHAASHRASRPLVARSAATLPPGLVDAELFGNVAGYPHAGLPARPGLVGEAHRSTLFLDELGELDLAGQAHLLRVLDGGEYHRLGASRAERADVRVVAATNRPAEALKPDLLARFTVRVVVPGLDERLEDLVLLARHLLARQATTDPDAVGRVTTAEGWPRLSVALVRALLAHPWTGHLRELDRLLAEALRRSPGDALEAEPVVAAPVLTSRAERLVEALLAVAGGDGIERERDDTGRVVLLVHPESARALLAGHPEFGELGGPALARVLATHPGVAARRERRAPHRDRRWWRIVLVR